MASKKIGCPLSSIFQQWTAQSQRQEVDAESSSSLSYRIVLQTSYSLTTRITAAEPVENPHLYKRAGLATPPERAIRDIHGAGETAWLLRLVELATKQQQRQKASGDDSSDSQLVSIIYLTTKSRSQNYSLIDELPQDVRGNVQVLDLGSRDPFGWDEEEKTPGDGKDTNLNNLQAVYQRLKMELNTRKSVILMWQSLTPLIAVHGFRKVLRLLCALPPCLQVWPVNTQLMTPSQHAQLEDASNAILQLQGGEMSIIRQGIRERGNVLRQKLPFQLEAIATNRDVGQRYRIVQESEDEERKNEGEGDDHGGKSVDDERDEYGGKVKKATPETTNKTKEVSRSDGRSRSTPLRIEENDGGRNESTSGNGLTEQEPAAPSRPRIYLQDDDPEFDDFDEEDPDDDLDI